MVQEKRWTADKMNDQSNLGRGFGQRLLRSAWMDAGARLTHRGGPTFDRQQAKIDDGATDFRAI
jgi:hypothetical protein